jgi:hypothetical protein
MSDCHPDSPELCLHCQISLLIQQKQRDGYQVGRDTLGRLIEVIADVTASAPPEERMPGFAFAIELLGKRCGDSVTSIVETGPTERQYS